MFIHDMLSTIPVHLLNTLPVYSKMDPNISVVEDIRVYIQTLESHLSLLFNFGEHDSISPIFRQSLQQFLLQLRAEAIDLFPGINFIPNPIQMSINTWRGIMNSAIIEANELHFNCLWALQNPGSNPGLNNDILNAICDTIREFGVDATQPFLIALINLNPQRVEQYMAAH